jgi:hypothetical protein
MAEQQAVLGGGCFWCTEAVFKDVIGVTRVESGYTGGQVPNPSYRQVCGGDTGPCRGDPGQLRSGAGRLRRHPRHPLRHPRSDPAQPPGQRRRHPISLGRLPRVARAGSRGARRDRAGPGRLERPDRHHDRAARRLVAGRGLPPGLLGGRRPAQSLLPRRHPAQAPKAEEELRRPGPERNGGLRGSHRSITSMGSLLNGAARRRGEAGR